MTVWQDQFDRLVPRFLPADWERINAVVDALNQLQAWAETHQDDGIPTDPVDVKAVEGATKLTKTIVNDLNARHAGWLKWRPWRKERWPLRGRLWRRIGGAFVAAIFVTIGVVSILMFRDPITAGTVEHELREMAPDAALVHCSGDDTKDRWTCTVVTNACPPAKGTRPCEGNVEAESRLRAVGETSEPAVHFRLVETALARAKPSPPDAKTRRPDGSERLRAWYRRLRHKEPSVKLVRALSG